MKPTSLFRKKVFISYSHRDKDWLERLRTHLRPLERELPQIEFWDDTKINVGSKWRSEIEFALAQTKVAVLLISADFLASDFIVNNELPPLLEAAEQEGAKVMPVLVSPSRFLRTESLSQFQSVNDPNEPLISMERAKQESVLVEVTNTIEDLLAPDIQSDPSSGPMYQRESSSELEEVTEITSFRTGDNGLNGYLDILEEGPAEWNRWRKYNPEVQPDLAGLVLTDVDLVGIDLGSTNLKGAALNGSNLNKANLRNANLENASLIEVNLTEADLTQALLRSSNLSGASLVNADMAQSDLSATILRRADLSEANLVGTNLLMADLQRATLDKTNIKGADLSGCNIYGISAWNLIMDNNTIQRDLVITLPDEPTVTVDNIEVAQFIYLFLYNEKIRDIIDAVSAKNVLILGRFTKKRKILLDSIREELRRQNYLPILFDFGMPTSRDIYDTLLILAGMARFIIVEISEPKSIAHELLAIVPNRTVPIKPIFESSVSPDPMFRDLMKYNWVLPPSKYSEEDNIAKFLRKQVIDPSEAKVNHLAESMKRLRKNLSITEDKLM